MDYTVYTLGDLPIFVSVLNAVAMVFSSSMFDPAQGAGVVVIGLLIGILMMVIPAMTKAKLDPMPFIFVLLIFFAGIVPKERLQIEDVYSGQVAAVDNIPLIVAMPASIIATISRAVTDNVETAFSTTDGSYLSMGAEGFANPLKLMLGFRQTAQVKRTFPYLSQSITEFVKYCAITDPGFSYKKISSEADMVAYLAGLNVSGVMTYWDAAHPLGYGTSCSEGATNLKRDTTPLVMLADAESLLKTATAGEIPAGGTSAGATIAGLTQAYNSVTAGLLGNMQDSQQFMVNAIAMAPVQQGIDCVNQPTGPNMSTCMSEVMTRSAMEQMNIDAAAQASIFTKTMIPAMNILLALFYAFSPIILAVAIISGAHGMKIVMGFLMFGAWSQSWMPIAAVLNFMIQMQTQYAISAFPVDGVTMENHMQFYSIISMKLGIASTLMAMTPMISMALLSGSMYALSNVAGGMGAKDYTDEKLAAPSAGTNDSLVKNGALVDRSSTVKVGQSNSNISGAPIVQGDTAGRTDFATIDASDTADKKASKDRSIAETATKKLQTAQARVAGITNNAQDQESIARQGSAALANVKGTERNMIHEYVAAMAHENNWTDEEAKKVEATLALKAKTGTPGEAIFGSGLSMEASASMGSTMQQKYAEAVKASNSNKNSNSYKASESAQKQIQQQKSHGVSFQQAINKSDQAAEEFKQASEEASSAEKKASESESVSRSLKGSKAMKSNEIAQTMVDKHGGASAKLKTEDAAKMAGLNAEAYKAQVADKVKDLRAHGTVGSDDTLEVAAGLEILSASGAGDSVLSMMQDANLVAKGTNVGMSEIDKQKFAATQAGVKAETSSVPAAVAPAKGAANEAVAANNTEMQVLSTTERKDVVDAADAPVQEQVSDNIAPPDSKVDEAEAEVEKAGLSDEWKLYKKAATEAGMMLAGGALGKAAGSFISKMAKVPPKSNPGMLGVSREHGIIDMAKADAKAAEDALKVQKSASRGQVTGGGVNVALGDVGRDKDEGQGENGVETTTPDDSNNEQPTISTKPESPAFIVATQTKLNPNTSYNDGFSGTGTATAAGGVVATNAPQTPAPKKKKKTVAAHSKTGGVTQPVTKINKGFGELPPTQPVQPSAPSPQSGGQGGGSEQVSNQTVSSQTVNAQSVNAPSQTVDSTRPEHAGDATRLENSVAGIQGKKIESATTGIRGHSNSGKDVA